MVLTSKDFSFLWNQIPHKPKKWFEHFGQSAVRCSVLHSLSCIIISDGIVKPMEDYQR